MPIGINYVSNYTLMNNSALESALKVFLADGDWEAFKAAVRNLGFLDHNAGSYRPATPIFRTLAELNHYIRNQPLGSNLTGFVHTLVIQVDACSCQYKFFRDHWYYIQQAIALAAECVCVSPEADCPTQYTEITDPNDTRCLTCAGATGKRCYHDEVSWAPVTLGVVGNPCDCKGPCK